MDFSKIKVLVIGGCGGIGTNICDTLIKHGVKSLGVIDILEENEAHDHFKGFLDKNLKEIKFNYMKCQVFEEDSLRKAFIEIGFEDLDILINAFGIQDERNYKKMIDVNITGVISSTLIGIEMMRKNKQSGIIINIGSVVSYRKMFKSPVYVATKHAVLGFTTSLAVLNFFN
uniref:CSON005871 protein n=1 Tax=Culicoides sonorensis TaxID=179676 RepID=A0A336K9R7_CULSO